MTKKDQRKKDYDNKVCPECESHLYIPASGYYKNGQKMWACGTCDIEYTERKLKKIYKQQEMVMDIIIRKVKGYGYLPMLRDEEGNLLYRGEFQTTPSIALKRCLDRMDMIEDE